MTAHRRGGWLKAYAKRAAEKPHVPATLGDYKPTIVPAKPKPPAESWWAKPTQSRAEFDQRAAERSREAGWVGPSIGDRR